MSSRQEVDQVLVRSLILEKPRQRSRQDRRTVSVVPPLVSYFSPKKLAEKYSDMQIALMLRPLKHLKQLSFQKNRKALKKRLVVMAQSVTPSYPTRRPVFRSPKILTQSTGNQADRGPTPLEEWKD